MFTSGVLVFLLAASLLNHQPILAPPFSIAQIAVLSANTPCNPNFASPLYRLQLGEVLFLGDFGREIAR